MSIDGLGDLAEGTFFSVAHGVSADGSVIVGYGTSVNGREAFRWTQTGGMVGLGDLAGGTFYSEARDVSADGSVIVGHATSVNGREAFRWTQTGGMVGLGDLVGGIFYSNASGVSEDGSIVVGNGISTNGNEAFRWTQSTGIIGLGDLAGGGFQSGATDVSADGGVVVGFGNNANGAEAFRWTQAGGMVGLGYLTGGNFNSIALGVSADGNVVVGNSSSSSSIAGNNGHILTDSEAFRWTQSEGMIGLGDLTGGYFYSRALDVSMDGSIVVGFSHSTNGYEAFRWTEDEGMRSVADILTEAGVNLSNWTTLTSATSVSADGNIIVGYGASTNGSEAFLANMEAGGLINIANFSSSIDDLHAAHSLANHSSRNLVSLGAPRNIEGISLSPVVSYVNGSDIASGGIALNYGTKVIDFQGSAGITKAEDEIRYGGETDFDGYWLGLGVATNAGRLFNSEALNPFEIIANVNSGYYNADIERRYLNGATVETSKGSPDLDAISSLARIGWRQELGESIAITPYGQILHTRTTIDSYTEKDGTFSGVVQEQKDNKTEYSVGLVIDWQASESLNLFAKGAWVTLNDDTGASIEIYVPNTGTTYISEGAKFDKNWGEYGVGVSWQLTEKTSLTGQLGGTEGSEYPENWYSSLSMAIEW